MTDPYFEIRRDGITHVGPVAISVHQRSDGKYAYQVEIDGDHLNDRRGFKFDWEAQDAATQAIRYATDIRSGRAFEHYLRDGAARTKGFRKKALEFFAEHFDEIKGAV